MTTPIAEGTIIAGKYRMERPLARGGMGSVWIARHLQLNAEVASKPWVDPFFARALSRNLGDRFQSAEELAAAFAAAVSGPLAQPRTPSQISSPNIQSGSRPSLTSEARHAFPQGPASSRPSLSAGAQPPNLSGGTISLAPTLTSPVTPARRRLRKSPRPPIDKTKITAAELSQELPADPGPHEIRASAPGYRAETLKVTLTEGKTAKIDLSLQPATGSAAGGKGSGGFLLPVGIASLAVGALGLGVGAATGVVSLNKVSVIEESCGGVHCASTDTENQREVREAKTLGNISTASFIAGGVLAASGAVMLILHQSGKSKPTLDATRTEGVGVSLGFGRVTLQARF